MIYFIFLIFLPLSLFSELPEPESVETYLNLFQLSRKGISLRLGGELQADSYSYLQHSSEPSQFLIRRARLDFDVIFQETFHLLFQPKFINQERIEMDHAFIETSYPKYALIRIGQMKEPISLQALQSSYFLNFMDRSLIANFLQIYDVGATLLGELWEGQFQYALGVFNGTGRLLEKNSNKEYVGRVLFAPFLNTSSLFKEYYLGISASTSRQNLKLSEHRFKTGARTDFWTWNDHDRILVEIDGVKRRWGADVEWFCGPFCLKTEFLHVNWGRVKRKPTKVPFSAHGGYIEMSYLLTGENKIRNQPVKPKNDFQFHQPGWGAFEIAVRYDTISLDSRALKKGLAQGASFVNGGAIGLNWYFNPYILSRLHYEHYRFNHRVAIHHQQIKSESVVMARLQAVY